MKLSLEEEIGVLQETRGLPVGQRCMALGYPEITLKGLEERFAVHKTAEAQNEQERARVYSEIAARFNISAEAARERFNISADGRVEDNDRARLMMQIMKFSNEPNRDLAALMRADEESLWNQLSNRVDPIPSSVIQETSRRRMIDAGRRRELERRFVMGVDWATPPAMLGTPRNTIAGITLRKVTGFVKTEALDNYMEEKIPERVLDSIQVAREAGLTNFFVAYPCLKVDQVELRQADPVVYAELGKRWLEIDYWE